MAIQYIRRGSAAQVGQGNKANASIIYVDSDTDTIKFGSGASGTTEKELMTSPPASGTTGAMVTKSGILTENGAATSYTLTVAIPAGAIVHSIKVIPHVLWNGTSASLKVGDTADDDGYFVGVNLKATDALVNEVLDHADSTLWGGKEGAYLVAATGQRGPTASNFGMSYNAGSNIKFIVTPGAADGTAGRTQCSVTYSVGEVVAQVTV